MKDPISIRENLRWKLSIVIFSIFFFFSLNCHAQVTTEKIVSNSEELSKRDFSSVPVIKYEPFSVSTVNAQSDSSGMAALSQIAIYRNSQVEFDIVKSEFTKVFPQAVNVDQMVNRILILIN
jgi:hypothetical protein